MCHIFAAGFGIGAVLRIVRWLGLLTGVLYFVIMLPFWLSYVGLLVYHVVAAQALSAFI